MMRGFVLVSMICLLTVVTIMVAATVPVYRIQAQRAEEEELIFRGEEYMRAIQKYQRKFNTYPPSVEALLNTNGIRFLRQAYADPVTGKPFRMIYINSNGSLTGSRLFNQMLEHPQDVAITSNPVATQFYRQQLSQSQNSQSSDAATPAGARWIVGVASESDHASIKRYNGRSAYNEWEFIAILH